MSDLAEFEAFPKIQRYLNETVTITEKIDGTNGAFSFDADGNLLAIQSRKRLITPGKQTDNAGFATWVTDNQDQLFAEFGPGRHFGEWWGLGIQRTYGLYERRFSPFNTKMWPNERDTVDVGGVPVKGVPTLVTVQLETINAATAMCHGTLRTYGSVAAPGFPNPEGTMLYLHRLGTYLKDPLDALPKSVADMQEAA